MPRSPQRYLRPTKCSATGGKETPNKWLRGQIAVLRGARHLAYPLDMSRCLRSVRLALESVPALSGRITLPRSAGRDKARRDANGYSIGELSNAGSAKIRGNPKGKLLAVPRAVLPLAGVEQPCNARDA